MGISTKFPSSASTRLVWWSSPLSETPWYPPLKKYHHILLSKYCVINSTLFFKKYIFAQFQSNSVNYILHDCNLKTSKVLLDSFHALPLLINNLYTSSDQHWSTTSGTFFDCMLRRRGGSLCGELEIKINLWKNEKLKWKAWSGFGLEKNSVQDISVSQVRDVSDRLRGHHALLHWSHYEWW